MEDKVLFETDVPGLLASGRLIEGRVGHVPCLVWDFEELLDLDADVDETAERLP
jgi:hypothetical protein